MFLEDVLCHAVLAEVEGRGGAREDLGHLPPGRPLPLDLPRGVRVDEEHPREAEAEPVQVPAHQRPQGEVARGGRCHLHIILEDMKPPLFSRLYS